MKKIILFFCLLVIFSLVFFFLGEKYQQRKFEKSRSQFFDRGFQTQTKRPGAGMGTGNFQRGEIVSYDEKTITLKLENGNQRIISVDEKTQFLRGEPISLENIKSGQKIMIWGKEISSDIFGANLILLLPSE